MRLRVRGRLVPVLLAGVLVAAVGAGSAGSAASAPARTRDGSAARVSAATVPPAPPAPTTSAGVKVLPDGGTRIFPGHMLVAYYGTAGSGALGVLGATRISTATKRLRAAARPFARSGLPVQIVYELIVTIADRSPGPDGSYSHDIARSSVQRYIRAAHHNHALLVLDLQPGRAHFLPTATHWAWALRDPYVGLALDPEWRMGPHEIPGHTIGHVQAAEVNRVSAWLSRLTLRAGLPQKLFMIHQFRTDMVRDISSVHRRAGLALVQHVDGFGTPGQKLATFHAVARPKRFTLGFKLFYRQDVGLMSPARVLKIRPRVRFVSYQ
ncbi:MAG: hypothetical protein ACRDPI_02375 [Nocardioidaceae bacterium]